MWVLRVLSGFIWVAGLIWFVPAAWSLYFQAEMNSQDAWHRLMASCALFVVAALVNIYEKLDQIAKSLWKSASLAEPVWPLSERVKALAKDPAKKIEAIKIYREETGASLAEAKQAIEIFIENEA